MASRDRLVNCDTTSKAIKGLAPWESITRLIRTLRNILWIAALDREKSRTSRANKEGPPLPHPQKKGKEKKEGHKEGHLES